MAALRKRALLEALGARRRVRGGGVRAGEGAVLAHSAAIGADGARFLRELLGALAAAQSIPITRAAPRQRPP